MTAAEASERNRLAAESLSVSKKEIKAKEALMQAQKKEE